MQEYSTIRIIVEGKVQGVFFRKHTREKAIELGITGYVENKPDMSVYIIASGTADQLEAFCQWCRTGPPRARVRDVIVTETSPQTFAGFRINV